MARSPRVFVVSLALFLAGCAAADDRLSKAEYEQKVRSVYAEVQQAFRETNVGSVEELPDRVAAAQDELRDAADELDDVEPPEQVEEQNEEIVEGMRAYADDLDVLRDAAERGDRRAIEDFNTRIGQNRNIERIAEAAEEMKFMGYDLGPIAEE